MNHVTILAYNIRNAPISFEDCAALIAPERLAQIRRFRPDDQLRSLCGDLLLLKLLTNQPHAPSLPLHCAKTEYGKPYLPALPDVHYNLSHSGDWVLCAVGDFPLGIDIQQERPVKPALFRRALSDEEQVFLNALPDQTRLSAFFDLWCLKEAYCKATGLGLRLPLHSFTVSLSPITVSDHDHQVKLLSFPAQGYHAGLCVKGPSIPDAIIRIITQIK